MNTHQPTTVPAEITEDDIRRAEQEYTKAQCEFDVAFTKRERAGIALDRLRRERDHQNPADYD